MTGIPTKEMGKHFSVLIILLAYLFLIFELGKLQKYMINGSKNSD